MLSKIEFHSHRVLDAVVQRGLSAGVQGLATVGAGKKYRKMVLCLNDGLKALQASWAKKADYICLLRDARKGRLAIRFACVDAQLTAHTGLLNWSAVSDSSAHGIVVRTHEISIFSCIIKL